MWSRGETVTVFRKKTRDRHGDAIDGGTQGYVEHHTIDNVVIRWLDSEDLADQRVGSVTSVRLSCPSGADVLATDQIRLPDGDMYAVDGKPKRPRSPFTRRQPYVGVMLKAVT